MLTLDAHKLVYNNMYNMREALVVILTDETWSKMQERRKVWTVWSTLAVKHYCLLSRRQKKKEAKADRVDTRVPILTHGWPPSIVTSLSLSQPILHRDFPWKMLDMDKDYIRLLDRTLKEFLGSPLTHSWKISACEGLISITSSCLRPTVQVLRLFTPSVSWNAK